MIPQPALEWVITEEQLVYLIQGATVYYDKHLVANEIRSRPLSKELKKERARVIKHLEEFTWLRYSENRICEKGMDEHCEIRSEIKRMECNGGEP